MGKYIRARSFSGQYFPAFGLNMEIYEINAEKYRPGKFRMRALSRSEIHLWKPFFATVTVIVNQLIYTI